MQMTHKHFTLIKFNYRMNVFECVFAEGMSVEFSRLMIELPNRLYLFINLISIS